MLFQNRDGVPICSMLSDCDGVALSLNNDLCLYRGRFAARKDVSYENFPAGALRQAACRFSCLMG